MKEQLHSLFIQAVDELKRKEIIPSEQQVRLQFDRTRQKEHGDFSTNVAMTLAKAAKRNPRELAELIIQSLPADVLVSKVEIAGPGFINIFLAEDVRYLVLTTILSEKEKYGLSIANSKEKILLEFVSANPTGPLHVGHGRGAAYGDALARVLRAAGNSVESEYYVNDAGRQMDILATSVWLRYLQRYFQQQGETIEFPDNCYKGDYIIDMAQAIADQHAEKFALSAKDIITARQDLDDEQALDATIALMKKTLNEDGYAVFFELALTSILADIREDLAEFGVNYDTWFSERSLFTSGKITTAIEKLQESEHIYEDTKEEGKSGALWFRSTDFGDEKDRVVVRENGQPTYFASDIAYHQDKLARGFDRCINIWGSDHHGYIPRVKAAMQAAGLEQEKLVVLLVQFAVLYRSGEKISMSTRSGEFVTLRELRDEVGADAARFFYVQRKSEQHMDFDLDLAKSKSNENPVYYVQYAHARICSIFEQVVERGLNVEGYEQADFSLLQSEHETTLLTLLQRFPEVIQTAAKNYEPHLLTYYLRDLATAFHSYYNSTKFLDADPEPRDAILALCKAVQQVLVNGLQIVGVSAPKNM